MSPLVGKDRGVSFEPELIKEKEKHYFLDELENETNVLISMTVNRCIVGFTS